MRLSTKFASVLFLTACSLSSQAIAQESAVEKIVNGIVANAIANVNTEIELQIEKFTLNAANQLDINPASDYTPQVTITDLPSVDENELAEKAKTKQVQVEKKETKSEGGEQEA